jgi:hypothetical protein
MGETTKMKLKMPSKGPRVEFRLGRWLLREIVSALHHEVAEAARRASFIEDRLTKEKSEANY